MGLSINPKMSGQPVTNSYGGCQYSLLGDVRAVYYRHYRGIYTTGYRSGFSFASYQSKINVTLH